MLEEIARLKRIRTKPDERRLGRQAADEDEYQFVRINKISLSDELQTEELAKHMNECLQRFLSSLTGGSSPIIIRLAGNSRQRSLSLEIGTKRRSGQSIGDRFGSYFQSVEYEEAAFGSSRHQYRCQALVTGIPAQNETEKFTYIEPFVRHLLGKEVMLEIVAKPVQTSFIMQQLDNVLEQRSRNSASLLISESISEGITRTETNTYSNSETEASNRGGGAVVFTVGGSTSKGKSDSIGDSSGKTDTKTHNVEKSDHGAVELDRLLELHIARLQQALSGGMWKTVVSVFANDKSDLAVSSEIYKSAYASKAPEPYQVFMLREVYHPVGWLEKDSYAYPFQLFEEHTREFSFLTSEELSYMADLPKEEYYGYACAKTPRFNQKPLTDGGIPLGFIYDGDRLAPTEFRLSSEQFVKHMLVAGITGSGKTNTIFNLLAHLNVPFLILEPAKKEYRTLKHVYPNLRVYTLGNEAISPIRINPFYFPPNVNIQQHIDNLKVIFNASFTMYASMPNILEQCITNVYIKKGWSLTASRNIYLTDEKQYYRYFPTIEDLYYEIDRYTTALGYAQEQTQNIRAALLTRIKSLMTGGKGWMLNTQSTVDVEELLKYPTVLELEAVADDDEKSLVIGLISVFIYEYLKSKEFSFDGELKHLLILEEAHRIFANVSQQGSQEDVNIKGKAVESLSHILSEIRAYGEGMVIVDQVPTKLAPDVLKNTNTKIIHRIVSKDDCEYIANSLGLSDEKVSFVSKLKNGAAIVFTDGMDAPVHLKIHHGKQGIRYVSDREVAEQSRAYNPALEHRVNRHPLAEIIAQNEDEYPELVEAVGRFYRSVLTEPLQRLQERFAEVKERIVTEAEASGFDLNMDVEDFVFAWIRESLLRRVKSDPLLGKQINKQMMMERYLEAILQMAGKDYTEHKKEYVLLELGQAKLRGDRNV